MQSEIDKIIEIRDIIAVHGQDLVKGMAVIVIGLIAIKWINQALKKGFNRFWSCQSTAWGVYGNK
jgi:hypothetical protein